MKRLVSAWMILGLLVGCLLGLPQRALAANLTSPAFNAAPILAEASFRNAVDDKLATDFGAKIDVNNTNVRAFLNYPGMYPTLARMIVQNAPFDSLDDVFKMSGLTERQKEVLESYRNKLTASPPEDALVEGGDRFNNGIYR